MDEGNRGSGDAGRALTVFAPASGRVIPLEEVPDPVFACAALGGGVGIVPACGTVASPIDGMVMLVADTGHAVLVRGASGVEVLVHCGIDTVRLGGRPFEVHVRVGDLVRRGDPLVDVDLDAIGAAGCDATMPVIITNQAGRPSLEVLCDAQAAAGDPLIELR